jgi:small subunit ribosomal protein S20
MPQTKSAKKRLRQNVRRRLQNRSVKSAARTQMKRVIAAVNEQDASRAKVELDLAYKKLDQAAAKRVMHKNAASRYKSRLAQKVEDLGEPAASSDNAERE